MNQFTILWLLWIFRISRLEEGQRFSKYKLWKHGEVGAYKILNSTFNMYTVYNAASYKTNAWFKSYTWLVYFVSVAMGTINYKQLWLHILKYEFENFSSILFYWVSFDNWNIFKKWIKIENVFSTFWNEYHAVSNLETLLLI